MVAKAVEKSTEKELLYFLLITDSNIFVQTPHPQVKNKDISTSLILAAVVSVFIETATWANFERYSNSSHLIRKSIV